ncbi:glycosyltransferase family 28 protein [Filimonas lacunae]|nr:glycosyltransferase family 28 protein [Filimonas lacunae]
MTIGTQEPFDRLIKAVDDMAGVIKEHEVVAQVAHTRHVVKHMTCYPFLDPVGFNQYFNKASLIIAHAGMGTIISALEKGKPIIVLPRQLQYKEHRSNHQMATAKYMEELKYIHVVYDEALLAEKVDYVLHQNLKPLHTIGAVASEQLLSELNAFISS